MNKENLKTHYIRIDGKVYECKFTKMFQYNVVNLNAAVEIGLTPMDNTILEYIINYIESKKMNIKNINGDIAYQLDYQTTADQIGRYMKKAKRKSMSDYINTHTLNASYTDPSGKVRHVLNYIEGTTNKGQNAAYFIIDWILVNFLFRDVYNTKMLTDVDVYLPTKETAAYYKIDRGKIIREVNALVSQVELAPFMPIQREIEDPSSIAEGIIMDVVDQLEYKGILAKMVCDVEIPKPHGEKSAVDASKIVRESAEIIPKIESQGEKSSIIEKYNRIVHKNSMVEDSIVKNNASDSHGESAHVEPLPYEEYSEYENLIFDLQSLGIGLMDAKYLISNFDTREIEGVIEFLKPQNIDTEITLEAVIAIINELAENCTIIKRNVNVPSVPTQEPELLYTDEQLAQQKLDMDRYFKSNAIIKISDKIDNTFDNKDPRKYKFQCSCGASLEPFTNICVACNSNILSEDYTLTVEMLNHSPIQTIELSEQLH